MAGPLTGPVTGVAPGRVNLIGEHLDYNGGACLPIALTQTTGATVTLRDDDRVVVSSDDLHWHGAVGERPAETDSWAAYVVGVLDALGVEQAMSVDITSDVPVGAGLSSSAALECSVAVAVDAVLGLGRSDEELVQACIRAENEYVGAPTGGLDQTVSVHGEAGHALLVDFAQGTQELVPFDPGGHGLGLLVMDTRVSHAMTEGGYGQRRDECEAAARRLGVTHLAEAADLEAVNALEEPLRSRARHVVSELRRVRSFAEALRAGDWHVLGTLLDAGHLSLRDDFEISCEELDVAVETAREAGAVGARMTGGGFGGSAIALVPLERVSAVRTAVKNAFVFRGWAEPAFIEAEPGPGARVQTSA